MSERVRIKSKKQHIRLWFECLNLCYRDRDKTYDKNLNSEKTKEFYAEWGDVTKLHFNDWWKEKSYLFEDRAVKEITRVDNKSYSVNVNIPLDQPIQLSLKQIREIMSDKKISSRNKNKYRLSRDVFRGIQFYVSLEMYKIYLECNKPPINHRFLATIKKAFEKRERSLLSVELNIWDTVERLADGSANTILIERIMRRRISDMEKTLLNVSKGKFP